MRAPTQTTFDRAFEVTVGNEGGFSKEHDDPGNWTGGAVGNGDLVGTKYGISAASYPTVDIADLTPAQAQAFYLRDFWMPMHGDELPRPLAILTFDAAVNNGMQNAARWLQGAVGAAVDGVIGPETLAAAKLSFAQNPTAAAKELVAQRTYFMTHQNLWKDDGLGWSRRLAALPYEAAI